MGQACPRSAPPVENAVEEQTNMKINQTVWFSCVAVVFGLATTGCIVEGRGVRVVHVPPPPPRIVRPPVVVVPTPPPAVVFEPPPRVIVERRREIVVQP